MIESNEHRHAVLELFAGCGELSEGFEKDGVACPPTRAMSCIRGGILWTPRRCSRDASCGRAGQTRPRAPTS